MPMKPENRDRYPRNWKAIRAAMLDRAGNRCEFCGVDNYSTCGTTKIVLTIAHLDHTPERPLGRPAASMGHFFLRKPKR